MGKQNLESHPHHFHLQLLKAANFLSLTIVVVLLMLHGQRALRFIDRQGFTALFRPTCAPHFGKGISHKTPVSGIAW
jgi:hypothetical protein